MRVAVTGKSGQVAQAIRERAGAKTIVVPIGRPELDLAEEGPCLDVLRTAEPDVIVSAAAYTAVDKAESEPDLAYAVNSRGAERVAVAAHALGVPLIHLSTDYVFDGRKEAPWTETDPVGPLSVYGASKLAGENAVLQRARNSAVLRVAWVYSPYGSNFAKTMMRLAETNSEVRVVADQIGAPTSALDIADGVLAVARNLVQNPQRTDLRGLFHMGAKGVTSWAGFAAAIFASLERRGGRSVVARQITTAEYPTAARRPQNSRLDSRKLAAAHGVALPAWQDSLERVLDQLTNSYGT